MIYGLPSTDVRLIKKFSKAIFVRAQTLSPLQHSVTHPQLFSAKRLELENVKDTEAHIEASMGHCVPCQWFCGWHGPMKHRAPLLLCFMGFWGDPLRKFRAGEGVLNCWDWLVRMFSHKSLYLSSPKTRPSAINFGIHLFWRILVWNVRFNYSFLKKLPLRNSFCQEQSGSPPYAGTNSQKWKRNSLNDILKIVNLKTVWQQAYFKHSEEEIGLVNLPLLLHLDGIKEEISVDIVEGRQTMENVLRQYWSNRGLKVKRLIQSTHPQRRH